MPRQKKVEFAPSVLKELDELTIYSKPESQPVITSITLTPMGSILGLADNKIYRYDDLTKKWVQK
jgi:hypothetical protein